MRLLHATGAALLFFTPLAAETPLPLLLHMTALLAMVMHWVAGHHFCILSYAESKLRRIPFEQSVLTRFLKPFFTFGSGRPGAYLLALGLFLLSLCRLVRITGQE